MIHTILQFLRDLPQTIVAYGCAWMALIVFAETGLLIGFFLPGDSLMFTAGMACVEGNQLLPGTHLDLLTVNIWLIAAAIFGDSVGYAIGLKAGQPLYQRERTFFFRRDHLMATKEFYEKHGGKTIVLARFVPFLRTFAPVVAGIAQMPYRRFFSYNVFGGVGWVSGLTVMGYFLGQYDKIKNNLEVTLVLIVFVSLLPAIITFLKSRKKNGSPPSGPSVDSTRADAKMTQAAEK